MESLFFVLVIFRSLCYPMDESNWKAIQAKTFTKWVNSKLKKVGNSFVSDIFNDLSDGVKVIELLDALGAKIENYNIRPTARIHKLENFTIILETLKKLSIPIVNIGPSDLVDGNEKLILGFIYIIILRFAISQYVNTDVSSLRNEILYWARKSTEKYSNVKIDNLTTSWQDGIAFNAIIHRFRPNLVSNFFSLKPENPVENCAMAFKIAQESLEIPRLFDPEDIVGEFIPDERIILTYLSQFFQKFKNEQLIINMETQLTEVIDGIDTSLVLKNDYEKIANNFLKNKSEFQIRVNSVSNVFRKLIEELKEIEELNNDLIIGSVKAAAVLDQINSISAVLNLKKYVPDENISINKISIDILNISSLFDNDDFNSAIGEFRNEDSQKLQKNKENLRNLLLSADSEFQNLLLNQVEADLQVPLVSNSKQKSFNELKFIFETKKKNILEAGKEVEKLNSTYKKAMNAFNEKDKHKTGLLSFIEIIKLLRSIGLEDNGLLRPIESDFNVNSEKLFEIIQESIHPKLNKETVSFMFNKLEQDGGFNLPDSKSYKGLQLLTNRVSYEQIEGFIEK